MDGTQVERWYLVCFCSPVKKMTVGMLLASVAFIAAALVQLEIDVRTATAATSTQTLNPHAVNSNGTISFLENTAKFPSRQGKPSEVHQHAEQKN